MIPLHLVISDFNQPISICGVALELRFPSIPLKIMFPQLKVTIVDSLNKRIQFLNPFSIKLPITGYRLLTIEAETFGKGVLPVL